MFIAHIKLLSKAVSANYSRVVLNMGNKIFRFTYLCLQDAKPSRAATSVDARKCERKPTSRNNTISLRCDQRTREAARRERRRESRLRLADRSGARQLIKRRRRRRPVALVPPCAASTTDRCLRACVVQKSFSAAPPSTASVTGHP